MFLGYQLLDVRERVLSVVPLEVGLAGGLGHLCAGVALVVEHGNRGGSHEEYGDDHGQCDEPSAILFVAELSDRFFEFLGYILQCFVLA